MNRLRIAVATLLYAGCWVSAQAQEPAGPVFGRPLSCVTAPGTSTLLTAQGRGFATSGEDGEWARTLMASSGYQASLPSGGDARDAALSAAGLLRRGHIVAAKMANDEANESVGGYKTSTFSRNFEAALTVLTQPVTHGADSEGLGGDSLGGSHGHGARKGDLDESSAALGQIISRAEVAKRAMGAHYRNPSIRNYLLAHGFRDEVALAAAAAAVCGARPNDALKARLDTSARFMAMPFTRQPAGRSK